MRGRKIDSPDVYLRPMMAKVHTIVPIVQYSCFLRICAHDCTIKYFVQVREALFSSLYSLGLYDHEEVRVLDIFAGSGSVGLEALSRGI